MFLDYEKKCLQGQVKMLTVVEEKDMSKESVFLRMRIFFPGSPQQALFYNLLARIRTYSLPKVII